MENKAIIAKIQKKNPENTCVQLLDVPVIIGNKLNIQKPCV